MVKTNNRVYQLEWGWLNSDWRFQISNVFIFRPYRWFFNWLLSWRGVVTTKQFFFGWQCMANWKNEITMHYWCHVCCSKICSWSFCFSITVQPPGKQYHYVISGGWWLLAHHKFTFLRTVFCWGSLDFRDVKMIQVFEGISARKFESNHPPAAMGWNSYLNDPVWNTTRQKNKKRLPVRVQKVSKSKVSVIFVSHCKKMI